MKKVFFGLMAIGLLTAASSCTKCGYCLYDDGSTSSSVCKNSTLNAFGLDEYSEAKKNCEAASGEWK